MDIDAVVSAICFDGKGSGKMLSATEIASWQPERGTLWLHIDYSRSSASDFLINVCKLDHLVVEALGEEETQPRSFTAGDNLFLVLRGLNFNPQADLLDMVAIRAWIEPHRIITSRKRMLMTTRDIRASLEHGVGPMDPQSFLVQLCDRMSDRMQIALNSIEEAEDDLEAQALAGQTIKLRASISSLRRRIITLRRYLAPQRQVLARLPQLELPWLDAQNKARLREIADQTTRHVDDLDAVRDRAAVAQDELESRNAEQMNRTMYLLSIVAAIFLPLGLITGLLGINVGGIPGTGSPVAFLVVCVVLLLIAGLEYWWFKTNKWL